MCGWWSTMLVPWQMIPQRCHWECGRCYATWCQCCDVGFSFSMPPTFLCGIYDITFDMPLFLHPHWYTLPHHQLMHTNGLILFQVQPGFYCDVASAMHKWHSKTLVWTPQLMVGHVPQYGWWDRGHTKCYMSHTFKKGRMLKLNLMSQHWQQMA